jgi:heme/copper-type cytochrome/quinol oxidase subunit 3
MVKEILAEYYGTRARRGTLLMMTAQGVIFAALLAVMFYLRWASEAWPAPFHFASLIMVSALTLFALSSSVTMEIANKASKLPDIEPAVRWIAVSIVTWLTFLFLEIVEWVRLVYLERLDWHTSFGATYLSLMVTHWVAVLGCVGWMTYVANNVRKRDVLACAMFCHFLNLIWLVLLFTLYFSNATLDGI